MKKIVFALIMVSAMLAAENTNAQGRALKLNKRQMNQHQRIEQGIHNGELTKREARHLRTQQVVIRHDKRMAKADGRITPREHRILAMEQNHANKSIHNLKHNNRHR